VTHTAVVLQALLFLGAAVLLALAGRMSLTLLAAAVFVLALGVPAISTAF
jgi:hypothetical protein